MKHNIAGAISACLLTLFASSSHSALISVLGGAAIYDSDQDVTWLADTQLSATTKFGLGGINSTTGAMGDFINTQWLAALNADGGTGWLGVSTWRLPTTLLNDPSCVFGNSLGQGCTGSEMGQLFHVGLGATAGTDVNSTGTPALVGLFSDLSARYRSSTLSGSVQYGLSWNGGSQTLNSTSSALRVMVLFDGGSENVVPVPGAVWLFGSGLMGLIGVARRKKV